MLVKTEIINIEWENDEDGDIAFKHGTGRSFILQLPDYELTAKEIDDEIRDAIETVTGHRPLYWHVNEFDGDYYSEESYEKEDDQLNLYILRLEKSMGYDMYDSAVVVASSPAEARYIHPNGENRWDEEKESWDSNSTYSGLLMSWGRPDQVSAELIGTSLSGKNGSVIISSFNAG